MGHEYLKKFFKNDVVEPIKYHVIAKRYLAREKKYFNALSEASKISLKLQGGVLSRKKNDQTPCCFTRTLQNSHLNSGAENRYNQPLILRLFAT